MAQKTKERDDLLAKMAGKESLEIEKKDLASKMVAEARKRPVVAKLVEVKTEVPKLVVVKMEVGAKGASLLKRVGAPKALAPLPKGAIWTHTPR